MPPADQIFHILHFPGYCPDTTVEMQSMVFPGDSAKTTFFTSHSLKARQIHPIPANKHQPDWILVLFLICFALLAWVQAYYSFRFKQILLAPFTKRYLHQLMRDGNLFKERISVELSIIYFVAIPLLLFQSYLYFLKGDAGYLNGFSLYLIITAVLFLYWSVKIILILFLGITFKTQPATREYLLNILILNIMTGLILLPVLVLLVYLKSLIILYICLIIFVLLFLFRFARGFLIGISISKFSYLFLFIYLCSVEILPLIVMVKLVLTSYRLMIHIN